MLNKSFEEMGISPGYGFKKLLFSSVANALVVQTRSTGRNWRPERLYFRRAASDKYRSIGQPAELTSQEFPFVHPSRPLLAYNSLQHRFDLDAQGNEQHGADWHSLTIFDLESGTEIASLDEGTLHLPTDVTRGWLASIVGFSDAGLFVTAGLSKNSGRMDYFIAKIDPEQRRLDPVTALPAVFM
jgi:hypothetical protein